MTISFTLFKKIITSSSLDYNYFSLFFLFTTIDLISRKSLACQYVRLSPEPCSYLLNESLNRVLKDNSGVTDAVRAAGVHLFFHYFIAVGIGQQFSLFYPKLFGCSDDYSCCARSARVLMLSGIG